MDIQNDDGSVDPYYSAFVEQKGLTPIIPKNSNLPSVIPQHQTKHQTKNPQYEAKPPPIIPKKDFKPPPMIPQIETKPPSIIPKIEVKPPSIIPQYEVKPPKIKHTPVINNVNLRPIIIDGSNVARQCVLKPSIYKLIQNLFNFFILQPRQRIRRCIFM